MSARSEILADIRRALGVTGAEAPRRRVVAERLEHAPQGVIPARGRLDGAARTALFRAEAQRALASVAEVGVAADAPAQIAAYLRSRDLPLRLSMGADSLLATLPWGELEIHQDSANGTGRVGLSRAFGAVAESGTLVLVSGDANPTRLNFLPETQIVLVLAAAIVGTYEEIWRKLRTVYGKGGMPRSVNFITGPSRSADIGQTMQLGAHGPRDLHIIVVRG
ncbi:MAG: lactate utilization protein [Methylovirgula sp.]